MNKFGLFGFINVCNQMVIKAGFTNLDESLRNSTECLEDFLHIFELLKEGDLEAKKWLPTPWMQQLLQFPSSGSLTSPVRKDISFIGACFYNSLHPLLFSICVAWFLFKCETGQAGIFGRILSNKAFASIGRYPSPLWHPIVMDFFYLMQRSTVVYTHFLLVFSAGSYPIKRLCI
ncbi:hypothetical protein CEXT_296831 [Caerostris extrusa]|uniref:Uncharacterized protein n=1 Tax=Caerostris extrusa TaxID=172846 RepID=A0AAV4QAW5_CAEEX|nr:hypothetical protein CEXT_296831 [Caerostris extrusa]